MQENNNNIRSLPGPMENKNKTNRATWLADSLIALTPAVDEHSLCISSPGNKPEQGWFESRLNLSNLYLNVSIVSFCCFIGEISYDFFVSVHYQRDGFETFRLKAQFD